MNSLKAIGFLLTYPQPAHQKNMPEIEALLAEEQVLAEAGGKGLDALIKSIKNTPLLDLQEEYVALFDRTPSLSLHLFEHVHGDSRQRGQAMVELAEIYAEHGLEIAKAETPDYLPLFLEYLSMLPFEDAQKDLGNVVTILAALEKRLQNRESPYADAFTALVHIAHAKVDEKKLNAALTKASGASFSHTELDEEWEEQFAFENTPQTTGQDGCPKADEMLRRMDTPPTPATDNKG